MIPAGTPLALFVERALCLIVFLLGAPVLFLVLEMTWKEYREKSRDSRP